MIKVLIMDDTPEKLEKIKSVLKERCLLKEEDITTAESINGGRKLLSENIYDLLILDLVMPVAEGEEVREEGQSETFINEMSRISRLNKPIYIIALTQYEQKIEEQRKTFAKKLWKLIHYDLKERDWEDILQDAVDSIIVTKKQLLEAINKNSTYDIGILCALGEEFEQMKKAISTCWTPLTETNAPFDLCTSQIRTEFGHTIRIIGCCCNVAGMQSTSVVASYLYSRFSVSLIIMTGFCAGFKVNGINYGDLFIAESEYDYGSGKLMKKEDEEQKVKPEPRQIPCSYSLLTKLRSFIREEDMKTKLYAELKKENLLMEEMGVPEIFVSPGACGSYVVGDEVFMNKLLDESNRKLRGLDMEGYGLYMAGHMLNKEFVLIKGIADYADSSKGDKFHRTCSYGSAWVVGQYIKKML